MSNLLKGVTLSPTGDHWFIAKGPAHRRKDLWEDVYRPLARGEKLQAGCGEPDCINPEHAEIANRKPRVPRVCGECSWIRYKGPHLITLETGVCYKDGSGRVGVFSNQECCPLWSRRSKQRRESDQSEHKAAQTIMDKMSSMGLGRTKRKK